MNILPRDIDTSGHLFGAFDHHETEISARWIVRFCQERGNTWAPISADDLQWFYEDGLGKQEAFHFNRLIEPGRSFSILNGWTDAGGGWVVRLPEKSTVNVGVTTVMGRLCTKPCDYLQVTDDFVERCYRSRPKAEAEEALP